MPYPNHEFAIHKITETFKKDESILAVIVAGSTAHGTAKEDSDVDLMIVISEEAYHKKMSENNIWEGRTLECGAYGNIFLDMRYIALSYIRQVIDRGNEPTRFAFTGTYATYDKTENINELLALACAYPIENKQSNINRFYAQLKTWQWFCGEAIKKDNLYLLRHSVNKLILFGGRLILAHNEILFPYHKWFIPELNNAEKKPDNILQLVDTLLLAPDKESIDAYFKAIHEYHDWYKSDVQWPNQFAEDCEFTWIEGKAPIDDI